MCQKWFGRYIFCVSKSNLELGTCLSVGEGRWSAWQWILWVLFQVLVLFIYLFIFKDGIMFLWTWFFFLFFFSSWYVFSSIGIFDLWFFEKKMCLLILWVFDRWFLVYGISFSSISISIWSSVCENYWKMTL